MTVKIKELTEDRLIEQAGEQTGLFAKHTEGLKGWVSGKQVVFLVAEDDANYIGRVELKLTPPDEAEVRKKLPDVPSVMALQVNEDSRRKGVGSLLMNALFEKAQSLGKDKVCLGVEPSNELARKFYEQLGFYYEGTIYESCWDEPDSKGEYKRVCVDAMLMVKELT